MGECLLVRRGGGTDTSDASAIENKVLAQETFYGADGEKKTGTMANNGVFTPAPLAAGGSIELGGYHAAGSRVTAATLASQTPATATAGHILVNQTAWVNGNKINGGIPATPVDANGYMPANEISGWAGNAFMGIQPYAYTNGHWVHSEQPDLQPANILSGKSIFKVAGTLKLPYNKLFCGTCTFMSGGNETYKLSGFAINTPLNAYLVVGGEIIIKNANETYSRSYQVGFLSPDCKECAIVGQGIYLSLKKSGSFEYLSIVKYNGSTYRQDVTYKIMTSTVLIWDEATSSSGSMLPAM